MAGHSRTKSRKNPIGCHELPANDRCSTKDAPILEQMQSSRRRTRPSSSKCDLLDEGRAHPRANAIFSTKDAPILEQMRSSRRRTRPSLSKCDLLDEGRAHPRANAIFSTKDAPILEQMRSSRRRARPTAITRDKRSLQKSRAVCYREGTICIHQEFDSDYREG